MLAVFNFKHLFDGVLVSDVVSFISSVDHLLDVDAWYTR